MGNSIMPICTTCDADTPAPTQDGQDNNTYICGDCQDKINLKEWKDENANLIGLSKKDKATVSQLRRLEKVKDKIKHTIV